METSLKWTKFSATVNFHFERFHCTYSVYSVLLVQKKYFFVDRSLLFVSAGSNCSHSTIIESHRNIAPWWLEISYAHKKLITLMMINQR